MADKRIEEFYEAIKKEMVVILATSAESEVSMRVVSPVYYEGKILIFTSPDSVKFAQMKLNPNCCLSAAGYFAKAEVTFLGSTMLAENEKYRTAYLEKFPGAFDEGVEFGGRNDDFLLLAPSVLSGWCFDEAMPNPQEIPTVPFEINF